MFRRRINRTEFWPWGALQAQEFVAEEVRDDSAGVPRMSDERAMCGSDVPKPLGPGSPSLLWGLGSRGRIHVLLDFLRYPNDVHVGLDADRQMPSPVGEHEFIENSVSNHHIPNPG